MIHMIMFPSFQNYSLTGLSRHTDYIVTVAARNLEGLGPEAVIELRTEDGGQREENLYRVFYVDYF